MKKTAFLVLLISIVGCSTNIFGPNKGSIDGIVKDNNGKVLDGVVVTAKFISSTNTDGTVNYKSINTITDQNGYHFLEDVFLTENEITFQKDGFKTFSKFVNLTQNNNQQTINVVLEGSPTITQVNISVASISILANDSSTITINIGDKYNVNNTGSDYRVNLLLYESGNLKKTILIPLIANAITQFVFEKDLIASDLPVGNFTISIEVIDPDGNFNEKETSLTLMINN